MLFRSHHVIENAAVIEVLPRGWDAAHGIPARVINSSPRTDVAILQMSQCEGIPEATLGDSNSARQGDEVYAVGNPLGSNPDSISRGIISHVKRYLSGPTPYLQTDATINPGNSGGALFDRNGEVIGISTAIATNQQGSNTGIGYAIPINRVREVIAQLRPVTRPPRTTMGWDELRKLVRAYPRIEIGSHTVDHIDLTSCDPRRARAEGKTSIEIGRAHV